MLLYHGSEYIIDKPIFGKGKLQNDYGRGFYCAEDVELAAEWAVKENQNGYTNNYKLDCTNLSILELNSKEYTCLHWLAILMKHRTFEIDLPMPMEIKDHICKVFAIDVESYDIVRGYRADDSYFTFAKDFINGTISYKQLSKALYLGGLGEQVVLKSKRAFKSLEFIGYQKSLADILYPKRVARDRNARKQYYKMRMNTDFYSEIFAIDILREEMKPDDPRLR